MSLSGCADGAIPDVTAGSADTADLVAQDVETPEIFQATGLGIWDGGPTEEGIWVAHPSAERPMRVILRNTAAEVFVVGTLFSKDAGAASGANTSEPGFELSAEAAISLGIPARTPTPLNVTAIQRALVPVAAPPAGEVDDKADGASPLVASAVPAGTRLSEAADVIGAPDSDLEEPFLQIGYFAEIANANATADRMRDLGLRPSIKPGQINDKLFLRVIVGPAESAAAQSRMFDIVRAEGFEDAFAVPN